MRDLTPDEIIKIHDRVQATFNVFAGIKDLGLIEAIAARPSTKIHSGFEPYDTVFLKAASIMEGIIRFHPFVDGNKRTALLATYVYLKLNGYSVVYPLSAVRFSVEIAKFDKTDQESTNQLIQEIANWLKKRSARNALSLALKIWRYYTGPVLLAALPVIIGQTQYTRKKLQRWLAIDIYPEYQNEGTTTMRFIGDILIGKYSGLLSKSDAAQTSR